jgi:hypothetical protein
MDDILLLGDNNCIINYSLVILLHAYEELVVHIVLQVCSHCNSNLRPNASILLGAYDKSHKAKDSE